MQVKDWKNISKLGDLQAAAEKSLWEMMSVTRETLHQEPYTKDEIVEVRSSWILVYNCHNLAFHDIYFPHKILAISICC